MSELHLLVESDLGPGQKTHRDIRLRGGGEAAGVGMSKIRRHEPIADFCRTDDRFYFFHDPPTERQK